MKAIFSYSTKTAYCLHRSEDIYSVSHVTTLSNHFTKSRIYAKYTKLVSNAHPSIMESFRTNVLLMSIIHYIRCSGIKPPTSSTLLTDFRMNLCVNPPWIFQKQSFLLPVAHFQPLPYHPSCHCHTIVLAKPSLTTSPHQPEQK